ncbi:hypothetical protein CPC08DRAFT_413506 [Agrocybe pediades]|nr:hypothetical protein CPC08DRAFT_413506 [Agrocybe pediades]
MDEAIFMGILEDNVVEKVNAGTYTIALGFRAYNSFPPFPYRTNTPQEKKSVGCRYFEE